MGTASYYTLNVDGTESTDAGKEALI